MKADRELGLGGKILLNASCKPQAKHLGKFFPECNLSNLHPIVGRGCETGIVCRRYRVGFSYYQVGHIDNYTLSANVCCSVADPNPDPPDPHVFGPSGSGSRSFHQQAKPKIVRKTLIPTAL